MKKLILVIIALALILIISGSAIPPDAVYFDDLFRGQGENWKAEFINKGAQVFYRKEDILVCDTNTTGKFTLTYIGKEKELWAKSLSYSYDLDGNGSELESNFGKRKRLKKVFIDDNNGLYTYNKTSSILVEVNIDDKTEHFELTRVK